MVGFGVRSGVEEKEAVRMYTKIKNIFCTECIMHIIMHNIYYIPYHTFEKYKDG
jgi:hypothetical protein